MVMEVQLGDVRLEAFDHLLLMLMATMADIVVHEDAIGWHLLLVRSCTSRQ